MNLTSHYKSAAESFTIEWLQRTCTRSNVLKQPGTVITLGNRCINKSMRLWHSSDDVFLVMPCVDINERVQYLSHPFSVSWRGVGSDTFTPLGIATGVLQLAPFFKLKRNSFITRKVVVIW